MSGKNQFPVEFNWQSTNPSPAGILPPNNDTANKGSIPSGVLNGAMTGTSTIYSQILDISRMDNMGLEVAWTGTPAGVFQVMVSNSGINFFALTFNPVLAQPSGSAGGYAVDLNQLPFKYIMLQYTNATGTGVLNVYGQEKDLN
jgi:hypothetical protein